MSELTYPIAEVFCSPQGEGREVGRLMIFLRLAGCTVGTRYPKERYSELDNFNVLPIYTNQCHIYDGRTMACDTDYRNNLGKKTLNEIGELISQYNCDTVCITGGEPLMHNILPLVTYLKEELLKCVSIETSGTIPISVLIEDTLNIIDHIAVSPKKGYLSGYTVYADELKILVDKDFVWENLPEEIQLNSDKIWLQPVNGEHTVNRENLDLCLAIQQAHPEVLISSQLHKFIGVQ